MESEKTNKNGIREDKQKCNQRRQIKMESEKTNKMESEKTNNMESEKTNKDGIRED